MNVFVCTIQCYRIIVPRYFLVIVTEIESCLVIVSGSSLVIVPTTGSDLVIVPTIRLCLLIVPGSYLVIILPEKWFIIPPENGSLFPGNHLLSICHKGYGPLPCKCHQPQNRIISSHRSRILSSHRLSNRMLAVIVPGSYLVIVRTTGSYPVIVPTTRSYLVIVAGSQNH